MVAAPPVLDIIDAGSAPAQQALGCYFEELNQRFAEGFEAGPGLREAPMLFNPPQGLFMVATLHGRIAGCGALQWLPSPFPKRSKDITSVPTAEIKRMWVDPGARGHGLGRRVLGSLEAQARRGGLRQVVLDTHRELHEAIALYLSCGYQLIERYNSNPHAHHFFAKHLLPAEALRRRQARAADWSRIVDLNNTEVPHVGPLQSDQGPWFADHASMTVLATDQPDTHQPDTHQPESELVAMVVVMTDGCGYSSPNYQWFADRYRHFAYIDRIVVRADFAGAGIAGRLYDGVGDTARAGGKPVLCAEVNADPPNDRSLRFHQQYGFKEVGQHVDPRNGHTVIMLAKTLDQQKAP